jgi:triacylglycerol lipase
MNLTAKQFDLANCRACAAASDAAYRGSIGVGDGFGEVQYWPVDVVETDTHALVIELADCVIIAFRGTASIRNWITDAKFKRTQLVRRDYATIAEVHEGFLAAFDSILPALTERLKAIVVGDRPVFITGHSLGGALATLSALEMQRQHFNIAQVYTFGQPRVGNRAFAKLLNLALPGNYFRVVYQEDIVARVPHLPAFHDLYWHAGTEVFISSTSVIRKVDDLWFNPPLWRLLVSDAWGIYRAWCVSKFAAAIDPIHDHKMDNYLKAIGGIES